MSDKPIDAEFTATDEAGTAVALRAQATAAQWTPSFAVALDDMVDRVKAKHEFFNRVMRKDEHYGTIPGGSGKPVLLKPGAELLLASMGLFVELVDAEPPIREYGISGGQEPMIAYRRICRIYKQTGPSEGDRMRVAQAEGYCTSRETKYRWREGKRLCPVCHAPAIIKGKAEYGGGWLCFKKQGGCNAKFMDADTDITSQPIGRVPNPDVADLENTILKMADKRALVAAALLATGCSDIFTQDIDDHMEQPAGEPHSAAPVLDETPINDEQYGALKAIWDTLPDAVALEAIQNLTSGRASHFTEIYGHEAREAWKCLRNAQLAQERKTAA